MDILFSKTELNELIILKNTLNSSRYVTIKKLADLIKSTPHNTWRIINKLHNSFNDYIQLEKDTSLGIKFNENKTNIDTYIEIKRIYIKNNLYYALIDSLFNSEINSVNSFCEAFYISPSLFYKKKKELDTILSKNKIFINVKKFSLESINEIFLREFMYNLYWETYKTYYWPFTSINKSALEELVYSFVKKNNINLYYLEINQIIYRLAIQLIRIKSKNFFDKSLVTKYLPEKLIIFLNDFNSYYEKLAPKSETDNEVSYLAFLIVSNYSSAYMFLPEDIDYLINYYKKKELSEFDLALNFFTKVTYSNDNNNSAYQEKRRGILHLTHINIYAHFFNECYIPEFYTESFRNFLPLNRKITLDFLEMNINLCNTYNLIVLAYYYCLYIETNTPYAKVKIVLDLSFDRMTTKSIKEYLFANYSPYIKIVNFAEEETDVDLIIADTFIQTKKKFFLLEYPSNENNQLKLKCLVKRIFNEKNLQFQHARLSN